MMTDDANDLKSFLISKGADLVGIADLRLLEGIYAFPDTLLAGYKSAISIGVSLERYGDYNTTTEHKAFSFLRKIASTLQGHLRNKGREAKVIAPDKRVMGKGPLHWRGEISHKAIARAAGLGWLGKSMLLVTPQFGPRVSLVTVLADMALAAGKPLPNQCGECTRCIDACTTGALRVTNFRDYPARLEDSLDVGTCGAWIGKSWRAGNLCYDCMLACPWGRTNSRPAPVREDPSVKVSSNQ